jgi:SSS family solute:Na+ symporter
VNTPFLAQSISAVEIAVAAVYVAVTCYLGWLGFRRTRNAADYLLAGREAHPFVMAMSYGATFISTSAIVGFGGVAALYGMSLLWLVFLNIFVGIFVAFIFLGGRTRRLGHELNAHTFPELLGRRFQSRGIQVFTGVVIFTFMPLYAAAVLIALCKFVVAEFRIEDQYEMVLLITTIVMSSYVIAGGLKGVMYTDALQGTIMLVVMLVLLVYTYAQVGGVTEGHQALTGLQDLVPAPLLAQGHRGWTATPQFGFGGTQYNMWWTVFSAITLGVGIGVLAQPQLVVRFMTVRSQRELNRAVGIGGLFILLIPGTAYVTGALSNVYFTQQGPLFEGRLVRMIDEAKGHALLQPLTRDSGGSWLEVKGPDGKAKPPIPVVLDRSERPAARPSAEIVRGRSIAVVCAKGVADDIIPAFITRAMPKWFGTLFMLTLLAAAMSTLSGQFHTMGTAMSRDVLEQTCPNRFDTVRAARYSILVGVMLADLIARVATGETVIARATAIFFGLCSATFLPAYVGGLFWRRMTKAAAVASMAAGFGATAFWMVFVKVPETRYIKVVTWLTGRDSLLADYPNWPAVDPVVVALPLSLLTAVLVSAFTQNGILRAAVAPEAQVLPAPAETGERVRP